MTSVPAVIRAEYCGGFRIHVTFNDGSENTIDFQEWLTGPVFEPLKNPEYFQRFFLDGGTVVWPNGADIAPEALHEVPGRQPVSRLLRQRKVPPQTAKKQSVRTGVANHARSRRRSV